MPSDTPLPHRRHGAADCRRCGTCCRLGGPALHREDLPLFAAGHLPPEALVTLRRGDWVTDNVTGGRGPSPEELVKLAPGPDGRACLFYREPPACAIHADRPLECRLLSCQAPEALEAAYGHSRLTRFDLLAPESPLAELCRHHEAETDLTHLGALCARALAGDRDARAEAARIVRLDAAFRELLPQRAGVAPRALPFYLGRPPMTALPACRALLTQADLYKAGA